MAKSKKYSVESLNENKVAIWIIFGVMAFVGIMWYAFENPALNPRLEQKTYTIIRKWDMPQQLNEISAMAWISEDRIACVQDEEGIIFIYNLASSALDYQTNFAKAGDYEAMAIVDSTAYVMRSDGQLYEVSNYLKADFSVETYDTFFSGKNNIESMTADVKDNRLLITVKNKDVYSKDKKGIYAFDLENKTLAKNAVYNISLMDPFFRPKHSGDDDDVEKADFYPSDIARNPVTGELYILQSKPPQLVIMDKLGKLRKLHHLDSESFPQPEGMTFSPEGALYISNEGKNGTASILEVELDKEK